MADSRQYTFEYALTGDPTNGFTIATGTPTNSGASVTVTSNGTTEPVANGDSFTVSGNPPGSGLNNAYTYEGTARRAGNTIGFIAQKNGTYYIFTNNQQNSGQNVNDNTSGTTDFSVCFTTGTLIRTERGDVAVQDLRVGDLAVTCSGALRPITWIGHRDLDGAGKVLAHNYQPIRVRADAFGPGLPARTLRLSPGHPVLVGADADGGGGHLVPIMCLINGTSIAREPVSAVTYWHVELDAHDILLAEALPAESYLDWGDRLFFTEAGDHALHNPDFVVPGLSARCRPVAVEGPLVEAERARLDAVFTAELAEHSAWNDTAIWLAA